MSGSRLVLAAALVAVFAALVGTSAPAEVTNAHQPTSPRPSDTPLPEGPIPCDPFGDREIDPRVVESGGEVDISVRFNWNCTGEDRVVNFFLVVENTSYLGGPRNQALRNVKRGLTEFVNAVNYFNGSKGGLTLFAEDYSNRVILRDGQDGKEALLSAIARISVEPVGNSAGAGAAIRNATERLPTGVEEGVTNVLVVVDAGAPVTSRPLIDLQSACDAAHAAGVHVMTIGLEQAGYRMAFCATRGWARWDPSQDSRDFTNIMSELADALVKGQQADEVELLEALRSAMEYVPGSASPEEPDNPFGNDFVWLFDGEAPPGGREVSYKAKVSPNVENEIFDPALESSVAFYYKAGGWRKLLFETDDICVHEPGDDSFCDGFPPMPTVTPGGETATPTQDASTPTATTAADTPTMPPPTDTPTDVPDGYVLYLPWTANSFDIVEVE